MEYVIEHPHINATKTVIVTPTKLLKGNGYRIEIIRENYTDNRNMNSSGCIFNEMLYEEELDGLILALQKAKMAKLLGIK